MLPGATGEYTNRHSWMQMYSLDESLRLERVVGRDSLICNIWRTETLQQVCAQWSTALLAHYR